MYDIFLSNHEALWCFRCCCTPCLFSIVGHQRWNSSNVSLSFSLMKKIEKSRKNDPVNTHLLPTPGVFSVQRTFLILLIFINPCPQNHLTFSPFFVNLQCHCFPKSSFLQSAGLASFHINGYSNVFFQNSFNSFFRHGVQRFAAMVRAAFLLICFLICTNFIFTINFLNKYYLRHAL